MVFLSMLWMPLLSMTFSERLDVSIAERRELATFPLITPDSGLLTRFPGQFETWFNDHFGMREGLVRWYNRIRVQWLGVSSSEWVLVGGDGWLYQSGSPHVDDMRNNWPYSDAELEQWAGVLSDKNAWLASQGIRYLFVVTPNKHVVYPEHLPSAINRVRPDSRAEQLTSRLLASTDVPVINLAGEVINAKENLRTHHKTDTHWNAWGAYNGYRAIVSRLRAWFPEISPIEYTASNFKTSERPGGDLADALAMTDIMGETDIIPGDTLPACAQNIGIPQDADEGIMYNNVFATECGTGKKRLLILRDSYAIALIPYLAETFAHVDYFTASPVPLTMMIELVREYKPDIVVEQRSSRWLRGPEG